MNRLNMKEQQQKNLDVINKFYVAVLNSLTDKLIKENRFKKNISEENILELQEITKSKLYFRHKENYNQLFYSFLQKKESSRTDFDLSEQPESTPNVKLQPPEELNETAVKTESKSVMDPQEEDQYVDDLAQFSIQNQPAPLPPSPKEEEKGEEKQEEEKAGEKVGEEDSEVEEEYNEKIQERIGSALLGTFSSFNIKRKPKEEKIFIELENAFLKYCNSPFETYYGRVTCELTKIEKEDIRQLKR